MQRVIAFSAMQAFSILEDLTRSLFTQRCTYSIMKLNDCYQSLLKSNCSNSLRGYIGR